MPWQSSSWSIAIVREQWLPKQSRQGVLGLPDGDDKASCLDARRPARTRRRVGGLRGKGVKRPKVDSYEGKTPAIADKEARQLMNLPNDHDADITKVQEWLGHANIATTRIYDRRRSKVEDSPTFKVSY